MCLRVSAITQKCGRI